MWVGEKPAAMWVSARQMILVTDPGRCLAGFLEEEECKTSLNLGLKHLLELT